MPVFTTLYEVLSADGDVLLSTAGTSTPSGYETITWVRPARSRRRLVEQGAYVKGEVETVSVLDTSRLAWEVRVRGTTYADLQAKYDALVEAVEGGPGMAFRVTVAGVPRTWTAYGSPNVTPRSTGREGDALRWSFVEEWSVDWPVDPDPT